MSLKGRSLVIMGDQQVTAAGLRVSDGWASNVQEKLGSLNWSFDLFGARGLLVSEIDSTHQAAIEASLQQGDLRYLVIASTLADVAANASAATGISAFASALRTSVSAKVIGTTLVPVTGLSESDRSSFNTAVRGLRTSGVLDEVIDFAMIPEVGSASTFLARYTIDGKLLNVAGHALLGTLAAQVVADYSGVPYGRSEGSTYYDATAKKLVNGIFAMPAPSDMTFNAVTNLWTSASTGRSFPDISSRPNSIQKGRLFYDVATGFLVNSKSGRRTAPQGPMVSLGRGRYRDSGTGRTYMEPKSVAPTVIP